MFGAQPGAERNQGTMNQHIVSVIDAGKMAYWVFHTRGEDATSVLITALTKEAQRMQMSAETTQTTVNEIVSAVRKVTPIATKQAYEDGKKDAIMRAWGGAAKDPKTLESLVNAATASCVLGFCSIGSGDDQ